MCEAIETFERVVEEDELLVNASWWRTRVTHGWNKFNLLYFGLILILFTSSSENSLFWDAADAEALGSLTAAEFVKKIIIVIYFYSL